MLTQKEERVLELLGEKNTQLEIARLLDVSPAAITHFKQSALRKIEHSRATDKRARELGFIILIAAFFFGMLHSVSATTPNPGHDASGIGAGTFSAGNFTFPNTLIVSESVGINTTTPQQLLDIAGNFSTTASSYLATNGGLVGIGTNTPGQILDIQGNNSAVYTSNSSSSSTPGGLKIMMQNLQQTTGGGSFIVFNAMNAGGFNNYGYIGAVSGASRTPAIVFGQRSGSSSYNESMRIDTNGNVGIGNSAPNVTLEVTGGGRFSTTLTASNGFTLTTGSLSLPTGSVTSAMIADNTIAAADLASGDFSSKITSGTYSVAISGNAATATALAANGANCAAGQYPLGVDASGAVEGCTVAGGGGANISSTNGTSGYIARFTNSTNIATGQIYDNGLIGIGTNNPGTTLDVIGSVRAQANLYVGNNTGVGLSQPANNGNLNIATSGNIGNIGLFAGDVVLSPNSGSPTLDFVNADSGGKRVDIFTDTSGIKINDVTGGSTFRWGRNSGGTTEFIINGSGSVGIGTATPASRLDLSGGNITMTGQANSRIYMGGSSGGTFGFAYDSSNPNYGLFYTEASPDYIVIAPDGSGPSSGTFRFMGDGRLGIGTTAPVAQLQVTSGTPAAQYNPMEYVYGSSVAGTFTDVMGTTRTNATLVVGSAFATTGGNLLNVYSLNTDGMLFVRGDGDVGIGTVLPSTVNNVAGVGGLVVSINNSADRSFLNVQGTYADLSLVSSSAGTNNKWMIIRTKDNYTKFLVHNDAGSVTATPLVIEHATGDVGIGTSTPNRGGLNAANINALTIEAKTASGGSVLELLSPGTTTGNELGRVYFGRTSAAEGAVTGSAMITANSANGNDATTMNFLTRSAGGSITSRVYLDSGGNVGIGTTVPNATLHVNGSVILGMGTIPSDTSGTLDWAKSAAATSLATATIADSSGVYAAGSDSYPGNTEWYIEKRNSTTGTQIWNVSVNPTANNNEQANGLALDGSGWLYIVGQINNGSSDYLWRIERRNATDGTLNWNVTVDKGTTSEIAYGAAYINGSLYVIGTYGATCSVRKVNIANGAYINDTNSTGCYAPAGIASDGASFYTADAGGANTNTMRKFYSINFTQIWARSTTFAGGAQITPSGIATDGADVYDTFQWYDGVSDERNYMNVMTASAGTSVCSVTVADNPSVNTYGIAAGNDGVYFLLKDATSGTAYFAKYTRACQQVYTKTSTSVFPNGFTAVAPGINNDVFVVGQNSSKFSIQHVTGGSADTVFRGLYYDNNSGFVGIGTNTPGFSLDITGNLRTTGSKSGFLSDVGEAAEDDISIGDVVGISYEETTTLLPGGHIPVFKVRKSTGADDLDIVGVVFEKVMQDTDYVASPGDTIKTGDRVQVATVNAISFLKASAENGPIVPGDYLMPANTPGYAMKADETATVIVARALSSLTSGTGRINAFVSVSTRGAFTNLNNQRLERYATLPQELTQKGITKQAQPEEAKVAQRLEDLGVTAGASPASSGPFTKQGNDAILNLGTNNDVVVTLG